MNNYNPDVWKEIKEIKRQLLLLRNETSLSVAKVSRNRPIFSGRGVRVYSTAVQTLSTGTFVALTFDTALRDDAQYWDVADSTKITIPYDGWYLIGGNLSYPFNATSVRDIGIRIDGGANLAGFNRLQAPSATSRGCGTSIDTIYYFTATQYIELMARQYSGGNLDTVVTAYSSPAFWCIPMFPLYT